MEQECAVNAVVRNEHHGLVRVTCKREAKRVGRSRNQVLKRVSVRKSHQMRGREPGGKKLGFSGRHLLMALHPPGAVIDVVQLLDVLCFDAAGLGDGCAGGDTA